MWEKGEQKAFLALVRAGLWTDVESTELRNHGIPEHEDWEKVYQLAREQSVVGLVLAGIERLRNHNDNLNISQNVLLQMIGEVQMMEQTNKAMNQFIAKIVGEMREKNIYTLLVKGQGVAQCYERPLWRQSGDVDLLLNDDNYHKAKDFLLSLCSDHKNEERYSQHLGLNIDQWYVEIHGSLRTGLSGRVDKEVDANQRDVFYGGQVRSWNNGSTQVLLPAPDNDVFFVFTHFIKHFYKEGMNLRQVCDWCRLLWTYRNSLDRGLLESRVRRAGLMSEWKAFSSLVVDYLGMPVEAMPLYDIRKKWQNKSKKVMMVILDGSHGKMKNTLTIATIFPWDTMKFLPAIFWNVNVLKVKERLLMQ